MERQMKSKFFGHLMLITKHRFMVFKHCLKCGLVWRGLVHDLSKFSPVEFWESVKYFSGEHSPIEECRKIKGYSDCWIHHKNHNKHHIEYWYDASNKDQRNMPYKYAVECICDKIAAAKCYNKKTYTPQKVLNHWINKGSHADTNDNMKSFFSKVFYDLVDLGEKQVLNKKYLKKTYNEIVLKKDIAKEN